MLLDISRAFGWIRYVTWEWWLLRCWIEGRGFRHGSASSWFMFANIAEGVENFAFDIVRDDDGTVF